MNMKKLVLFIDSNIDNLNRVRDGQTNGNVGTQSCGSKDIL